MRRSDRELKDRQDLLGVLGRADSCHLAMVDQGSPYLVTMNFGFEWTGDLPVLYLHSAREGRKITVLRRNPEVCFSLDVDHRLVEGPEACHFGMAYGSLVGMGTVEFVEDSKESERGLRLLMSQYTGREDFSFEARVLAQTQVLKIVVREVSGKRKG